MTKARGNSWLVNFGYFNQTGTFLTLRFPQAPKDVSSDLRPSLIATRIQSAIHALPVFPGEAPSFYTYTQTQDSHPAWLYDIATRDLMAAVGDISYLDIQVGVNYVIALAVGKLIDQLGLGPNSQTVGDCFISSMLEPDWMLDAAATLFPYLGQVLSDLDGFKPLVGFVSLPRDLASALRAAAPKILPLVWNHVKATFVPAVAKCVLDAGVGALIARGFLDAVSALDPLSDVGKFVLAAVPPILRYVLAVVSNGGFVQIGHAPESRDGLVFRHPGASSANSRPTSPGSAFGPGQMWTSADGLKYEFEESGITSEVTNQVNGQVAPPGQVYAKGTLRAVNLQTDRAAPAADLDILLTVTPDVFAQYFPGQTCQPLMPGFSSQAIPDSCDVGTGLYDLGFAFGGPGGNVDHAWSGGPIPANLPPSDLQLFLSAGANVNWSGSPSVFQVSQP